MVDDIDQVQDNTVVMLRMLVFRFADDFNRDAERIDIAATHVNHVFDDQTSSDGRYVISSRE